MFLSTSAQLTRCLVICVCLWNSATARMITNKESCGVEASPNLLHRNPWLVYLEYWENGIETNVRCGATVIDNWHVITAGHCIKDVKFDRIIARLGEYDTTKERDCVEDICADKTVHVEVSEVIINPDFNGFDNDIAVLRMITAVPYTDFIRPICLPTKTPDQIVTFYASGWGEVVYTKQYSEVKKIIPLPNWKPNKCKYIYSYAKLPQKIICAGGEEGVDTCRGDSGGPLTYTTDKVELIGVTSFGSKNCGTKDAPGIYTRVTDYLEWILEVTRNTKSV